MADSDNESGGGGPKPCKHQRAVIPQRDGPFLTDSQRHFITGEASDKCQREKRKTVNGDDLLWAMTTLGFEEYVEPLKVYLQRFREAEGEKITVGRDKDAPSNGSGIGVEGFGGYVYGSGGFCFNQMGDGGPGDSLGRLG
ncbi:hypothetical protein OIU84_024656 [Salix udensis]|uniref:Transcription factor CBF/NF-Y/archaeal histone domain-containing protein n=1 Tax=Salix udensis TaxID=889485 RepID=A0AAD6KHR2_9ROSI|nr:hypothetical protein OIU84_024656 [Salix udensis]